MSTPSTPPPGSMNDDRGPELRSFVIVLTVLTVIAISLRFWSRTIGVRESQGYQHRFWWDDWIALLSIPFMLSQFGLEIAMVHYGLGHHVWAVQPGKLLKCLRLIYAVYFVYDIAICLTKASALLFLSRIFPKRVNGSWFNVALWIIHAMNVAWLIGILFGTIFMCNPVEKNWNPTVPGHCGPTSALWIGSAVPNVVIDLMILILPLPKIWGLQISRARKVGLTIVFALGYCVVIVSLGRLITLLKNTDGINKDITYEIIPVSMWVSAEAPISLVCICLPAMLPLGRHLVYAYFSPLATKVSSMLSSRKMGGSSYGSKSGAFNMSTATDSRGIYLDTAKTSNAAHTSTSEQESIHSVSSTGGILPTNEQYWARVRAIEPRVLSNESVPDQSIRVDRDIKVSRQGR